MPQTYPADTVNIPLAEDLTPADILADLSGVSANRLYGFEQFIVSNWEGQNPRL
jgi:hypothetical protein